MKYETWKALVTKINVFQQSMELKALTAAFEIYAQRATPTHFENLKMTFNAWKASAMYGNEKRILGAAQVQQLEAFVGGSGQNVLAGVKATEVKIIGARFYKPGDILYELDGDRMLPADRHVPDLTPAQIQRVNECLRRTRLAAAAARDWMIPITSKAALARPLSASEQTYVDYFGAFDQGRAKTVLNNFKTLHSAITRGGGPIIFDHRNTDFGEDCYAACKPGRVADGVKIWFGRDFFSEGRASYKRGGGNKTAQHHVYSSSTDATVGTLIHEFSHGTFAAVDAPPVDGNGNWVLQPDQDWESPDNSVQASTPEKDKALARKEPLAAIVNADNYGQFAVEALKSKGG